MLDDIFDNPEITPDDYESGYSIDDPSLDPAIRYRAYQCYIQAICDVYIAPYNTELCNDIAKSVDVIAHLYPPDNQSNIDYAINMFKQIVSLVEQYKEQYEKNTFTCNLLNCTTRFKHHILFNN